MQIVIRPAAAADIEDAFVWYEQQRRGLGSEFLKIVDDALIVIQRAPQLHPVIHRNTRRALLRRFPYGIYYRIYPDLIVVVACMHGRRNPRRWQSRT
jgi:plasmid stabilization system protein ParE